MNAAERLWQQAITRHGEKYTRLPQEHHDNRAAQPSESADLHQEAAPFHSCAINTNRNGIGNVEIFVVHQTRQHGRDHDVNDGADRQ